MLNYRLPALLPARASQNSRQAPIPGPAMTRAGSTSTALPQEALTSNPTAWQR